MRVFLVLAAFLAACANQPSAATSPTPSATPVATTTAPSPTPTTSPSPSPIPLPTITQLSAPSANVVWALVAGTRLFRSTDRGTSWTERTLPSGLANAEVAFADETNGLLLATGSLTTECQTQTAVVWRTVDAAASWQKLAATGIADAMCKRGLGSLDATHALFVAWSQNNPPFTYGTADAGQIWKASLPLPDPPGFTTGQGIVLVPGRPKAFASVVLLDAADNRQQARYAFRSTDGGATWAYAATVSSFEGGLGFVTAARWILLVAPGSSRETTDAGASWHAYAADYGQAAPIAPEVVFGDAMVGYATVRGGIQRTVDGGLHWSAIATPGTS